MILATVLWVMAQQSEGWWVYEMDGDLRAIREDGRESKLLGKIPARVSGRSRISPDGRRWVYVSAEDGDAEIWTCDADGSNAKKLTDNDATDTAPDWSPDGKRIAFASTRSGLWQVWVLEADGAQPRVVTKEPNGAREPRFSPRGDRLAYLAVQKSDEKLSRYDLVVAALEGKERVVLVPGERVTDYAWDPAGKRIAVSVPGRLATIDVETRKRTVAIDYDKIDPQLHFHGAHSIVWRPDGAAMVCRINFLGGRKEGTKDLGDRVFFVLSLDGGPARKLQIGEGARPVGWIE